MGSIGKLQRETGVRQVAQVIPMSSAEKSDSWCAAEMHVKNLAFSGAANLNNCYALRRGKQDVV
jgi:hypothetical protein